VRRGASGPASSTFCTSPRSSAIIPRVDEAGFDVRTVCQMYRSHGLSTAKTGRMEKVKKEMNTKTRRHEDRQIRDESRFQVRRPENVGAVLRVFVSSCSFIAIGSLLVTHHRPGDARCR